MAAGTENPGFPLPVWDSEEMSLKDLLMKSQLPNAVKFVKGQFMNIGVSKFPLKKLHQEVAVHSIKTAVKVLAHSVARLEGRDGRTTRMLPLDQRLAIPLTYQGWFELLSEDGRSARPIDIVHQLAKLFPEKCLVRQNVKAYMVNDEGKLTFDKTKVVLAGEQLTLSGDITVSVPKKEGKLKFLRCTDTKGTNLYLNFDQRGLFTPIAGAKDITGVLNIKDIIHRFRLPLTVRLVQGVWPRVDSNRFTGFIRLDWVYTDETAFVCPLDKSSIKLFPIPTEVPLKLVPAKNNDDFSTNGAFKNIMIKCNRMVANYGNTIHLIVQVPDSVLRARNHSFANLFTASPKQEINSYSKSNMKRSRSKEDIINSEIDDLYSYLREGIQPPKNKFAYDSDEESYWEEPAYEPLDDFRARLALLEKGQPSTQHTQYKPADLTKIPKGSTETSPVGTPPRNGHLTTATGDNSPGDITVANPDVPPALPPRNSVPPIPSRRFVRADSAPLLKIKVGEVEGSGSGSGSDRRTSDTKGLLPKHVSDSKLQKQNSKENRDSPIGSERKNSGISNKDTKSSRTSSSNSGGKKKPKPTLLYL